MAFFSVQPQASGLSGLPTAEDTLSFTRVADYGAELPGTILVGAVQPTTEGSDGDWYFSTTGVGGYNLWRKLHGSWHGTVNSYFQYTAFDEAAATSYLASNPGIEWIVVAATSPITVDGDVLEVYYVNRNEALSHWERMDWAHLLTQALAGASPSPADGLDGWFLLDTDTNILYGPAFFDPSLFPSGGPWNWGSPLGNVIVSSTGPTNEYGPWYVWDENGDGSVYSLWQRKRDILTDDILTYTSNSEWEVSTHKLSAQDVYFDAEGVSQEGGVRPIENALRYLLEFKAEKYVTFNNDSGTAYTLTIDDFGKMVSLDNAATITLTVPAGVFQEGDVVGILQRGAGQVQVVGDTGVTVNSARTLNLRTQWSTASLICIGPDEFLLAGDLA